MLEFIATNGEKVVPWLLGLVGLGLARWVWVHIAHAWTRQVLQRAYDEVVDAVLEVWQTYTSELKRARQDGLLTDAEKREARRRAVEVAKANLGTKGLKRLANALGVSSFFGEATEKVERWIESKTEAAVAGLKSTGVMKSGGGGVGAASSKAAARPPS